MKLLIVLLAFLIPMTAFAQNCGLPPMPPMNCSGPPECVCNAKAIVYLTK